MKKLFLLLSLGVASFGAVAQTTDIYAFTGYTTSSSFDIYGGKAYVRDGSTSGVAITVNVHHDYSVQAEYSNMITQVRANSFYFNDQYSEYAHIHYVLLGGQRVIAAKNDKLKFFGGVKFGLFILDFDNPTLSSYTRFAAGLGGGMKLDFNRYVGMRAGIDFKFPITNVGASLGWSSGGGTYVGVSGWSPILQFGINAGIFVRLGND